MPKILKNCICIPLIFIIAICGLHAKGQLSVSGQLRTRTEFRDGSGTLKLKINTPSSFPGLIPALYTIILLSFGLLWIEVQNQLQCCCYPHLKRFTYPVQQIHHPDLLGQAVFQSNSSLLQRPLYVHFQCHSPINKPDQKKSRNI